VRLPPGQASDLVASIAQQISMRKRQFFQQLFMRDGYPKSVLPHLVLFQRPWMNTRISSRLFIFAQAARGSPGDRVQVLSCVKTVVV
jgi:hypothetical protein